MSSLREAETGSTQAGKGSSHKSRAQLQAVGYWYVSISISVDLYHLIYIMYWLLIHQYLHFSWLTSRMWRSFTAHFIYLVLTGDMKDSSVRCSLQASYQQCKIIWKYSKVPKVQLELPDKAVGWLCSRLFHALELGSGKGRPPALLREFTDKLYLYKRWCNPSKAEAAGLHCCCPSWEEHVVSVATSSVRVHPCCSPWLCWGGRTCWWQSVTEERPAQVRHLPCPWCEMWPCDHAAGDSTACCSGSRDPHSPAQAQMCWKCSWPQRERFSGVHITHLTGSAVVRMFYQPGSYGI